ALDLQLDFIVGQTEKYSDLLTQSLNETLPVPSKTSGSHAGSTASTDPFSLVDGDFQPHEESDDEETIEVEEQQEGNDSETQLREIELLKQESELPLEELLQTLPPQILENSFSKPWKPDEEDEEFTANEEEAKDEEETIDAEEKLEGNVDHSEELDDLAKEGELPMEELLQKYDEESEQEESEVEDTLEEERREASVIQEEDFGVEYLLKQDDDNGGEGDNDSAPPPGPKKEITDIAAAAESLQPKGYTLATTQVKTPIPYLLRGTLREYQHIGLDWLVTMYEKKLNGILADEMGLGKTIQTISLLAHLACEKGSWGPHLIIVPTSVMLNWEMEIKRWCPSFKILTYYGAQKERKLKRQGWTKPNAFHICITSYKLVLQDHQAFRRKNWKYLILDEAQNIKNFKSQRWQSLLNFNSQRRLLLTGTPLQNSLMELWSLMHFLMPHVFQSHREFKEWFSNPLTGMIEGSQEYNENLVKRLHKVLRPFLLRRVKVDVEKQMPKKYEHVIKCRLSKRQRYLYDDFMAQATTKETLATGHFMSVINILMQLRKVCNHPNLFDPRPIHSPFITEGICFNTASLVLHALDYDPFKNVDFGIFDLINLEGSVSRYETDTFLPKWKVTRKMIEEIAESPDPPPRPKPVKMKVNRYLMLQPMPKPENRTVVLVNNPRPTTPLQRPITPVLPEPPTPALAPVPHTGPVLPGPLQPTTLPASQPPLTSTLGPGPASSTTQQPTSSIGGMVKSMNIHSAVPTLPGYNFAAAAGGVQQRLLLSPDMQARLPSGEVVSIGQLASLANRPLQGAPGSKPITFQIQGNKLTLTGTQVRQVPMPQPARQLPRNVVHLVSAGGQHHIISQPAQVALIQAMAQQAGQNPVGVQTVPGQQPPTILPVPATSTTVPPVASTATISVPIAREPSDTLPHFRKHERVCRFVGNPHDCSSVSFTVPPSPPPTVASFAISPAATVTVSANTSPTMVSQIASSPMPKEEPEMLTLRSTTPTPPPPLSILAPRLKWQPPPPPRSPFFLEALEEKRKKQKEERLDRLFRLNEQHCNLAPIYGTEVLRFCTLFPPGAQHLEAYWQRSETLAQAILTPQQRIEELTDIIERFIFVMPPVEAPAITMHTSHPPPTLLLQQSVFKETLRQELSPHASCLHRIICNMRTQFPDLRLIQYDCGKLQTLDILLRQLKAGAHRVLIFTQMTRMLDVLEQFLNYHGHIYLRLDGSTRVEQRQALMERFNADKRIFCFILSTRSGGVGVNLTGADTVVFYDSDWNPTMDAQAQDRCHRIGQTRDVHIYRLISERTVEENILKKANQKRMLGDMAIEGGNFTTAYFKQQTIRDLFDMPLDEPTKKEGEAPVPVQEEEEDPMATKQTQILEQALCKAEDPEDIRAATQAKAEQVAELAEFNENIPLDAEDRSSKEEEEEFSKAEQEIASLVEQLTPIERYAMNFLEASLEDISREELKQAEEQVEAARKDIDQAKDEVVFKLPEDEDESYLLEEGSSKKSKKAKFSSRLHSERTGTRMSERLRSTRLPPKDGDSGDVESSQTRLPIVRHSRIVTAVEDDNLPQVALHTRSASVLCPGSASSQESSSLPGNLSSDDSLSPNKPPRRRTSADVQIQQSCQTTDGPAAKVLRKLPGRLVTVVEEKELIRRRRNRILAQSNTSSEPVKRKRGRPPKNKSPDQQNPGLLQPFPEPALEISSQRKAPVRKTPEGQPQTQSPEQKGPESSSPKSESPKSKTDSSENGDSPVEKRRRGRPPKTRQSPIMPPKSSALEALLSPSTKPQTVELPTKVQKKLPKSPEVVSVTEATSKLHEPLDLHPKMAVSKTSLKAWNRTSLHSQPGSDSKSTLKARELLTAFPKALSKPSTEVCEPEASSPQGVSATETSPEMQDSPYLSPMSRSLPKGAPSSPAANSPPKRKRGRPPKNPSSPRVEVAQPPVSNSDQETSLEKHTQAPPGRKRRRRRRKDDLGPSLPSANQSSSDGEETRPLTRLALLKREEKPEFCSGALVQPSPKDTGTERASSAESSTWEQPSSDTPARSTRLRPGCLVPPLERETQRRKRRCSMEGKRVRNSSKSPASQDISEQEGGESESSLKSSSESNSYKCVRQPKRQCYDSARRRSRKRGQGHQSGMADRILRSAAKPSDNAQSGSSLIPPRKTGSAFASSAAGVTGALSSPTTPSSTAPVTSSQSNRGRKPKT
uniref:Snf2-related CREBBP activator protein n=1 Tax=Naja naja TaxID=35670 RepID=A0A8C6Y1N0_NAJNA